VDGSKGVAEFFDSEGGLLWSKSRALVW
jgi:hypothetical protein